MFKDIGNNLMEGFFKWGALAVGALLMLALVAWLLSFAGFQLPIIG